MYVGSSVFGGSSIYGGQGVDLISVVGTVTGSTVGGNLGDTIELQDVVKGAAIWWWWLRIRHFSGRCRQHQSWFKAQCKCSDPANGGNDTSIRGDVLVLHRLWRPSADTILGENSATSTKSLSGSLIAGNRGNDKIVFNSTQSVFNTEVYGSDSTGTLAGNVLWPSQVSLSKPLRSTAVLELHHFGVLLGKGGQILKADVNAFAGNDSIKVGGSFVSSTVKAGAGNDHRDRSQHFFFTTSFYAGTGADSVLITDGANITVYGDASASDTAGGADSLQVTALASSVYGAAGGDTLNVAAKQRLL